MGWAYICLLGAAQAACSLGDFDSLGAGPELNVGGDAGTAGNAGSGGRGGTGGSGGSGGTAGNGGTPGNGGSAGVGGSGGEAVNVIANPGFEQSSVSWVVLGPCTNSRVQDNPHDGDSCLKTTNRGSTWNGPAFTLTNKLTPGASYLASVWVRGDANAIPDGGSLPVQLSWKRLCPSLGDPTAGLYTPFVVGELTAQWVELIGPFTYPDCSDLGEFTVYVEGPPVGVDIYLDDTIIMLEQ